MQVPTAELATVAVGIEAALAEATYMRKSDGWESFQCACGKNLQLSPAFKESKIVCNSCGKSTTIVGNETK